MLAESYQQPLYVNCSQPMMLPPPPPPPQLQFHQYSPYATWSPPYYHQQYQHTQPQPLMSMARTPGCMALSPSSSGRFDAGYDSDASGGSFAGMSPPQTTQLVPADMAPAVPYQHQHQHQHQHQACWRDSFVASFTRFPTGQWHLRVVSEPPDVANTGLARNLWRYQRDQSARVRFACRACGASTVGTGQAVFWIYKDDAANVGHIHLKLYGQKCPAGCCKSPAADAVWEPREAARAIAGLFQHVAQSYYGMAPPAAVEAGHRSRSGSSSLAATTTTES